MTPEEFLNNFGVLADSPNGVPKLRRIILELAVRGRLVRQDPRDTPVSIPAQVISQEARRPSLPSGWQSTCLSTVARDLQNGISKRKGENGKPVPVIRLADIVRGQLKDTSLRDILLTEKEVEKYKILPDDILVIRVNGSVDLVGRFVPCKANKLWAYSDHLIRIRLHPRTIIPDYLCIYANTPIARKHIISKAVTTAGQKTINQSGLGSLVIDVPPLAEQKRIIAKVNQLMALCDELEARQTKKRETGTKLTQSALDALTSAEGPEEFAKAWQRVAGNFQVLLNTPESIGKVRKTILELAVRGKLVRQDPADGPASEVIQFVSERRLRLQAEKKIGRLEPAPDISTESAPYALPSSWLWTRLANVTACRDGQRIPVSKGERQQRQGPYDYYGASGVIDTIDDFIFDEPLLLVGEDGANLLNRSTPIAFIAAGKYWVNNHAHVLDGANLDSLRYLAVFINAIDLAPYVTGTAQPKMNQAKMNSIPVPVPPLAEQKRIVAKVDQLLALCDTLESKLRDAEQGAQRLAEAMVAEMVA